MKTQRYHSPVCRYPIADWWYPEPGIFKFHSPANLAKSIAIEAGELLECFQWSDTEYDRQHVKEELADVIVYCQDMLDKLHLDGDEIVNMKMDQNEAKYPVEKSKGRSDKYDVLS